MHMKLSLVALTQSTRSSFTRKAREELISIRNDTRRMELVHSGCTRRVPRDPDGLTERSTYTYQKRKTTTAYLYYRVWRRLPINQQVLFILSYPTKGFSSDITNGRSDKLQGRGYLQGGKRALHKNDRWINLLQTTIYCDNYLTNTPQLITPTLLKFVRFLLYFSMTDQAWVVRARIVHPRGFMNSFQGVKNTSNWLIQLAEE